MGQAFLFSCWDALFGNGLDGSVDDLFHHSLNGVGVSNLLLGNSLDGLSLDGLLSGLGVVASNETEHAGDCHGK